MRFIVYVYVGCSERGGFFLLKYILIDMFLVFKFYVMV